MPLPKYSDIAGDRPSSLVTNLETSKRQFLEQVLALYGKLDMEIRDTAFSHDGSPLAGMLSVHRTTDTADVPAFWRAFRQLRAGR